MNGIKQPVSQPASQLARQLTFNITTLSTALPIFRTGQQQKVTATATSSAVVHCTGSRFCCWLSVCRVMLGMTTCFKNNKSKHTYIYNIRHNNVYLNECRFVMVCVCVCGFINHALTIISVLSFKLKLNIAKGCRNFHL